MKHLLGMERRCWAVLGHLAVIASFPIFPAASAQSIDSELLDVVNELNNQETGTGINSVLRGCAQNLEINLKGF